MRYKNAWQEYIFAVRDDEEALEEPGISEKS